MITINEKEKIYIRASLEDNLDFILNYPEGKDESFRKLLNALDDEEKLSLNDEEKEIAIESLQDYQTGRFDDFDYEWQDIDNILNHLHNDKIS